MFSRYSFFGGRRQGGRREGEVSNLYVDRYPVGLSLLVVGIFLLNVLDAVFTLLHLQQGGQEWNPIVAQFLVLGPQPFFFIKCGITAGCLLFLLMHVRFYMVKRIFQAVFGIYACVFCYHMYLNSL